MSHILFSDFKELAEKTISFLTHGSVALSVGSTYAQLFPCWLAYRSSFPTTEFFPVDERLVPFEAPQSNWGTAYRLFLQHAGRVGDKQNWPQSAPQYGEYLARRLGKTIPVFDSIFLGVGTDGHTASLFPGEPYLDDSTSSVLQTRSPIPPNERITLGPATLASCRSLIVVISGKGKEEVAQRVLDKDKSLPVVQVVTRHPSPLLFVSAGLVKAGS